MAKIIKLENERILFNDGSTLTSYHAGHCCEHHELDPTGIDLEEVKDLEFDLTKPLGELIEKVDGYGIRLISSNNFPLSIPAYGYNNGYYSDQLDLTLTVDGKEQKLDITECQEITDD